MAPARWAGSSSRFTHVFGSLSSSHATSIVEAAVTPSVTSGALMGEAEDECEATGGTGLHGELSATKCKTTMGRGR